jgi:hypothetical protein
VCQAVDKEDNSSAHQNFVPKVLQQSIDEPFEDSKVAVMEPSKHQQGVQVTGITTLRMLELLMTAKL